MIYEDRDTGIGGLRVIVASDGDTVAGSIHYRVDDRGVVEVLNLIVAGPYRGQGIAHALCDEIVAGPLEGKIATEYRIHPDGTFASGGVTSLPIPADSLGLATSIIDDLRTTTPERFGDEAEILSGLGLDGPLSDPDPPLPT